MDGLSGYRCESPSDRLHAKAFAVNRYQCEVNQERAIVKGDSTVLMVCCWCFHDYHDEPRVIVPSRSEQLMKSGYSHGTLLIHRQPDWTSCRSIR
jgi:hypothetical protein